MMKAADHISLKTFQEKKNLLQMSWAGESVLLDALPSKERASSIKEFAKGRFSHIRFGVRVSPTWYGQ
jgi:hypothetical protein